MGKYFGVTLISYFRNQLDFLKLVETDFFQRRGVKKQNGCIFKIWMILYIKHILTKK